MSKPTIVFVPGFWEGTTVYSAVTSILESQYQYKTRIIPLVSTGTASPHHKTFSDDVRYIREAVEHLVNEGKDIVLVGHSASAAVASEAVEGLARTERNEKGLEGGISRLVFLAGSLAPERATIGDCTLLCERLDKGDRMYPRNPLSTLFNDIPTPIAEAFLKEQCTYQPTAKDYDAKITYCGWKDIPSVYLCCKGDALLPTIMQEQCADMVGAELESCSAGHMAPLSQPDKVVEVIRRAAGEEI